MKAIAISLILASTLGGCTSFRGPGPIYGPTGVTVATVPPLGANPTDLRSRFVTSAKYAESDPSPQNLRTFMNRGFTLTYANCDAYFQLMGRHQRRARIFRDTITPVTALITGLIPLINFNSEQGAENALKYIALGSAFTTSGLGVYDQHFLFGAENIDSVRTLTMRALVEHMNAAQGSVEAGNFEQAVIHILDNFAVCTPQRILTLTRQAIANGDVEVRSNGGAPNAAGGNDPPPPPPPVTQTNQTSGGVESFTPGIAPPRD